MHASTPPTLLFISPIETIANLHQWVSSLRLEAQMKGCCLPTYLPTYLLPSGRGSMVPMALHTGLGTASQTQPLALLPNARAQPQWAASSLTKSMCFRNLWVFATPPPLSFPPKPSSTPSCPSWFWEPLTHHSSTALALFNHGREQVCLCLPHNLRTEESAWHPVGALYMFVNSNVITLFLR